MHAADLPSALLMACLAFAACASASALLFIRARADDTPNTLEESILSGNQHLPPSSQEHVKIAVETMHHLHHQHHQVSTSSNIDNDNEDLAMPTNKTIAVPVGPIYRNTSVLHNVSGLYLLDNAAVTCIPYLSAMPTGPHGHPFTVGHPAVLLSDGGAPVTVGMIVCTHAGQ